MMSITEFGYISLYIFVVVAFVITYRNALIKMDKPLGKVKIKTFLLITVFIFWTVYLYFVGESGVLWNFDFPPRFPLMIFIPLTIIIVFLFVRNRRSLIYLNVKPKNVIFFQSFRIGVEYIIFETYLEGIFPIHTTFAGYNYEIMIGILAPIVAFVIFQKKWVSLKWAILFNIIGLLTLCIIIFIVITSLYFPKIWGLSVTNISEEFTRIPYLLLPGLLAPAAIFAHVFSLIQIRKMSRA